MKRQLHLLLVLFFANLITAQSIPQPNDCVNAIAVSGNGTFGSNTSGIGSKQEVVGCNGQEHNSIWLKISIAQTVTPGSKLGFDLIPKDSDISVDFDFWVFGPNKDCGSLGAPIRCNTTNPLQAALTNNYTGMNGSALAVTAWSGTGGNNLGYVNWLTVNPGESYYIVVDRPYATPSGNIEFYINWTGTATIAGTLSPTANKIADLFACTTSNTAFFDLDNNLRSQINSDITNNAITFHGSLADAVDGKNPLNGVTAVSTASPKPIYAKVVNQGGYYTITDFNLKAVPLPTASISLSKQVICPGSVTVAFSGTPGAMVDYTINGGAVQSVLLDASGTFLLTDGAYSNRTYVLVKAKIVDGNNNEVCFQSLTDTKTVTVNPSPAISGKASIHVSESTQLTGSGTPATLNAWTSSNPSVATVSSTGLVSGVSAGWLDISYTDINGCSNILDFFVTASNLANETPELKDFSAKLYPNPFNTAFMIDINTLNLEPLKIKVYDMLGRLVDQMEGNPDKMADQKIGQNYASGIYNIVITQEEQMKTIRIIKE